MTDRRVLDNWKEIASYLGRTGKTCRNWEKEYGLPVHRLDGSSRAHVFAYPDEIDRWKEEMLREEKKHAGSARDLRWEKELLGQNKVGGLILRLLPRLLRKPLVAIVVIASIAFAFWFFPRQAKIRQAKYELLPKVVQLAEDANPSSFSDSQKVYQAAIEAEKFIPGDPTLAEVLKEYTTRISVTTDPAGAKVYIKPYQAPEEPWEYLGVSPLESPRLPLEYLRLKMEKEGYETVFAASTSYDFDFKNPAFTTNQLAFTANNIFWKLDKLGDIPSGMVRVVGVEGKEVGKIDDFFVDRLEVTNKQYKEFVDKGGYENREFWKNTFVKDGRPMTWEQAMAEFVDVTGRPGPATWRGGHYPEGQDDYPVSGVSWYEAAAYAAFARKSLPTGSHWEMARGRWTPLFKISGFSEVFIPQSNFRGKGPDRVGSNPGITAYGLYDMGGNVREWCWNEIQQGRLVRGGAWDEEAYKFANWGQLPPFDRSAENGFRCAIYINPELIPQSSFAAIKAPEVPDYSKLNPVTDPVFSVYRDQFSYDKRDLNARVEWRNETSREWIQERISFDAAYGNERVFAYLFLPRNTTPPFQTVIYFPTSVPCNVVRTSNNIEKYFEFMPFIPRNGRAFLFPVYKGTFERGIDDFNKVASAPDSYQYSEFIIKVVKDFRRSVDYLETRPDIDRTKLAYVGSSWGGINGPIVTALEDRLKASVLKQGGLRWANVRRKIRPEVDPFNYVSRVKIPTLMLNGRYDTIFALESGVKPMFQLLGTPPEQKELKVYDTDHTVPDLEFVKETLRWLDKYLGPPK